MKKLLLPLFVILPFCTVFCQHQGAIALVKAKFITGDDAAFASVSFNDNEWKNIEAGKVWQEQGYPDYHGYAWYRFHVTIPSAIKQDAFWKDSLRLFLAHVNDVDETYFNGVKIGKTGSYPNDDGGYVSKWPAVRSYHIAANASFIHWDAENIIAIKVYDGGGTGGIFMGTPFLDMLEKTDGISVSAAPGNIQYHEKTATVPLALDNSFNTMVKGVFSVTVTDESINKNIVAKTYPVALKPFENRSFDFTVPGKPGIRLSYQFKQTKTANEISASINLPYILTPPASQKPAIHNPAVVGVHPGSPFLLRIAASGKKPMTYQVTGLPAGIKLDATTGILSGSIKDSGIYKVVITATNALGLAQKDLVIKSGSLLALTPPMGWNSWNCWGINVSEAKVKSSAQALLDKGLADYGWSYINIDDGWEAEERAADGTIRTNEKFPDMKGLGDWLHSKGLKFGIYSSPGPKTCGGYLGSYTYEEKDAASYANWGVDYLKYDWCSYDGIAGTDTSLAAYIKPYDIMDKALAKQGRDIIYSLCQYGMKDVWKWGSTVHAQSWRTTGDIDDTWQSLASIGFNQARLFSYAGPGHWNDPDMMIVGQVGWGENLHPTRLTPDEQYTHVSLWSLLAAPLLIGCDISKMDAFTLNLLTNNEVIAINQDVLGAQAKRIVATDSSQVWVKPLENGSKAVGIFNTADEWKTLTVKAEEIGARPGAVIYDVWRQADIGKLAAKWSSLIPPHGVLLITVK